MESSCKYRQQWLSIYSFSEFKRVFFLSFMLNVMDRAGDKKEGDDVSYSSLSEYRFTYSSEAKACIRVVVSRLRTQLMEKSCIQHRVFYAFIYGFPHASTFSEGGGDVSSFGGQKETKQLSRTLLWNRICLFHLLRFFPSYSNKLIFFPLQSFFFVWQILESLLSSTKLLYQKWEN